MAVGSQDHACACDDAGRSLRWRTGRMGRIWQPRRSGVSIAGTERHCPRSIPVLPWTASSTGLSRRTSGCYFRETSAIPAGWPSLTARRICCIMQVRSTVWKGPWSRWLGRGSPAPMEEKWHACSPAVFARRACAWSAAWPAALIWRCMRARWRREAIPSACWAAASTCPIRLNTGPSCGKSQVESV